MESSFPNVSFSSYEDQSDYYATLKSMKTFFQNRDNETFLEDIEIPLIIETECTKV